jgi:hypothetical protein
MLSIYRQLIALLLQSWSWWLAQLGVIKQPSNYVNSFWMIGGFSPSKCCHRMNACSRISQSISENWRQLQECRLWIRNRVTRLGELGDCLLWTFFLNNSRSPNVWATFFPWPKLRFDFDKHLTGWAIFWSIFSQTHLVNLIRNDSGKLSK